MSKKILVTGATGTIGKALVKALQAKGASFKAAARDLEKAKKVSGLTDGEVVYFDFTDINTYKNAIEGIDTVFLLGPPVTLNLERQINPFLDFIKSNDIKRVVYISAMGAENMGDDLAFHAIVENKLQEDGFEYTILKPSFFAQNFKNYEWENITQRGITYVVAGKGKAGFVDVEDIAAVAAAALTEDTHIGKTYHLTGPETLSYYEAADILSDVTGKTIVYPNPTPEEYTGALKAAGAPDFIAKYMINVYSLIVRNEADITTDDVERVTGKKPTGLKEVLLRDFANN